MRTHIDTGCSVKAGTARSASTRSTPSSPHSSHSRSAPVAYYVRPRPHVHEAPAQAQPVAHAALRRGARRRPARRAAGCRRLRLVLRRAGRARRPGLVQALPQPRPCLRARVLNSSAPRGPGPSARPGTGLGRRGCASGPGRVRARRLAGARVSRPQPVAPEHARRRVRRRPGRAGVRGRGRRRMGLAGGLGGRPARAAAHGHAVRPCLPALGAHGPPRGVAPARLRARAARRAGAGGTAWGRRRRPHGAPHRLSWRSRRGRGRAACAAGRGRDRLWRDRLRGVRPVLVAAAVCTAPLGGACAGRLPSRRIRRLQLGPLRLASALRIAQPGCRAAASCLLALRISRVIACGLQRQVGGRSKLGLGVRRGGHQRELGVRGEVVGLDQIGGLRRVRRQQVPLLAQEVVRRKREQRPADEQREDEQALRVSTQGHVTACRRRASRPRNGLENSSGLTCTSRAGYQTLSGSQRPSAT